MSENRYLKMLPGPNEVDNREAVVAFRELAEAIQDYCGGDVEVNVSVHKWHDENTSVRVGVYVPKTDYNETVLSATCDGTDGFPTTLDFFFLGEREKMLCRTREELDAGFGDFLKSKQILGILEYMRSHARPKKEKDGHR